VTTELAAHPHKKLRRDIGMDSFSLVDNGFMLLPARNEFVLTTEKSGENTPAPL
jgi:hypothetical protein